MKIKYILHEYDDWPAEWKDSLTDPWAYIINNEIHLRAVTRISAIQHELWHCLMHTGNESHHPWWHFCVASYNPIRFDYHGGKATRTAARRLAKLGELEFPDQSTNSG